MGMFVHHGQDKCRSREVLLEEHSLLVWWDGWSAHYITAAHYKHSSSVRSFSFSNIQPAARIRHLRDSSVILLTVSALTQSQATTITAFILKPLYLAFAFVSYRKLLLFLTPSGSSRPLLLPTATCKLGVKAVSNITICSTSSKQGKVRAFHRRRQRVRWWSCF